MTGNNKLGYFFDQEGNGDTQKIEVKHWKYKISNPIKNVLTLVNSGTMKRSKVRNLCAFSASLSII